MYKYFKARISPFICLSMSTGITRGKFHRHFSKTSSIVFVYGKPSSKLTFENVYQSNTFVWNLQHTATHCNTLQHTATYCNTPQHTATHCNTLQHSATLCNTHCNNELTVERGKQSSPPVPFLSLPLSLSLSLSHTNTHAHTYSFSLSRSRSHSRSLSLSLSLSLYLLLSLSLALSLPPPPTVEYFYPERQRASSPLPHWGRPHYREGLLLVQVLQVLNRGGGGGGILPDYHPKGGLILGHTTQEQEGFLHGFRDRVQNRDARKSYERHSRETHARLMKDTHAWLIKDTHARLTRDLWKTLTKSRHSGVANRWFWLRGWLII